MPNYSGYWYTIKAFKQIDIIEVKVNTNFNLSSVSRYKTWVNPQLIPTYKYFKGVYPSTTASLSVVGLGNNTYKVQTQDVDNGSIAYVLCIEDDLVLSDYPYEYPLTTTFTGSWETQHILNAMEVYTVNSSNDFTFILPKNTNNIKIFPVFDYMTAPLGLREFTFNITKVNNRSWKVQPMFRYSYKTDFYRYINNCALTVYNASLIRVTTNIYYRKFLRNNDNSPFGVSTVYYNIAGSSSNYTVYPDPSDWETSWVQSGAIGTLWHPVEYQTLPSTESVLVRTNEMKQTSFNVNVNTSLGKNATKNEIIVSVTRLGDSLVPYNNCGLKIYVIYE
ncbi:hypothetical protein FNU3_5 [Fusobacterium phage vB_FnuS_FNU3]|uniref:Uncharacterized protein n=1 Tax=Fusobacterium phage Fnu1 TaxID=2530024 RepID=A0A481W5P3_9CAUD|nr:hypothetical protein KMD24_gp034 [Fusobacterium phage Fnu1]QBJ04078.1 hypothetical protein [Fusobacterium phage Fnu1]WGH50209.1 hypothetical protein FNU2_144 [Fusobacterium phage vB_FnuS_FNU2]WGH50356.1 hypothetical protein FNU3_5 [Fusobacterium phage vB_FnuS_FNU3]